MNFPQQDSRQQHTVNILTHRDDGASYKGVLTFTATEPVDIGIGHRVPLDNSTFSQNESEELGELFTVRHNDKGELGVPGIVSAPYRECPFQDHTRLWNPHTLFLRLNPFCWQFSVPKHESC